ncbi:hypothetical protein TKK_0017615 [Trichogramma kaykai]
MDAVIDIQFIKNSKNECIPKEVAVTSIQNNYIVRWVLITPTSKNLPMDIIRQNNWLVRNYHGLDYYDGEVSTRCFLKTFRELAKKINKVYVRGNEKLDFIQNLMSREVINLEYDPDCPSFLNPDTYCIHHGLKELSLRYACALNNVIRLKNWIGGLQKFKNSCDIFQNLLEPQPDQDEQFRALEEAFSDIRSYNRSISGRSNPQGVDETDGIYF